MKEFVLSLVTLTALLMFSSGAVATTPQYCDPAEDPDECGCPSGGVDACAQVSASELIQASDPAALRQAANITSVWNSRFNRWDVTVDATAMPGYGVIALPKTGWGQWSDTDEVAAYLSELIGNEVSMEPDGDNVVEFPPMSIQQVGATHRLDLSSSRWAPANSNNLIFDVLTDGNGVMSIGEGVVSFFGDVGCDGDDQYAFDAESDGVLEAEQCSDSRLEQFVSIGAGIVLRLRFAGTLLETGTQPWFGTTLKCRVVEEGTTPLCWLEEALINVRVRAEELGMESHFFRAQVYSGDYQDVSLEDEVEVLQFGTSSDGVCSSGYAAKGQDEVHTWTRDGAWYQFLSVCVVQ